MKHFRTLAILDFVLGGLELLLAAVWLAMYGAGSYLAPIPELQVLLASVGVLVGALLILLGVLALLAGALLFRGRSLGARILQSVIAAPHLFNVPLGTAFALYSLWVCWVYAERQQRAPLHDPQGLFASEQTAR